MNILRLLLLFFVGLFVRRLFTKGPKTKSDTFRSSDSSSHGPSGNKNTKEKPESLRDITEQEIDDADFEEIP